MRIASRFIAVVSVALALASSTVISPGISTATECGPGTVYDAPSDTCVAVAQPPPAPYPPYGYGGYGGYGGDFTPGFSVCLGGGRRFLGFNVCL